MTMQVEGAAKGMISGAGATRPPAALEGGQIKLAVDEPIPTDVVERGPAPEGEGAVLTVPRADLSTAATTGASLPPASAPPASEANSTPVTDLATQASARAAAPAPPLASPPVIAILLDGPPNGQGSGEPVYVGGGRIGQYADAVREMGGEVRWVWDNGRGVEKQLDGVHGLLVPGGRDVNPKVYKQRRDFSVQMNLSPIEFDLWECDVMRHAMTKKMPVRGICRGLQLLNVIGGGTLMQDINDHLKRPWKYSLHHAHGTHPIAIIPTSVFGAQIGKPSLFINSSHHQAIADLAGGYEKTAVAADGVIEAIEKRDDPTVMGVQFHPERAEDDVRQRFFGAFVRDADRFQALATGRSAFPPGHQWTTPARPTVVGSPSYSSQRPISAPRPADRPSYYSPTTSSATQAAAGASSSAPPVIEVEPSIPVPVAKPLNRDEELASGLKALTDAGFEVLTPAGHAMQPIDLTTIAQHPLKSPCKLRSKGATEALMEFPRARLDDFLLTWSPNGERLLDQKTRNALDLVRETMEFLGKQNIGDVFTRGRGWLKFKRERLTYPIEVYWACEDRNLYLNYRGRANGTAGEHFVNDVWVFKDEVQRMKRSAQQG